MPETPENEPQASPFRPFSRMLRVVSFPGTRDSKHKTDRPL